MRKLHLYLYYGVLSLAVLSQVLVTLVSESVWVKRNTTFNTEIATQDMLLAQRKRLEIELAKNTSLSELEAQASTLGFEPINTTIAVSSQIKLADSLVSSQ